MEKQSVLVIKTTTKKLFFNLPKDAKDKLESAVRNDLYHTSKWLEIIDKGVVHYINKDNIVEVHIDDNFDYEMETQGYKRFG